MGDDRKPGMVSKAVTKTIHKSGSVGMRFLVRFLFWGGIIAVLSELAANATWGQVYGRFGLPLSLGESSVYWAVRYGALVASVMGGAAVALAGMIWKS